MSADPGRPSEKPSKRPSQRLQFRSASDFFEDQPGWNGLDSSYHDESTWKLPAPPPSQFKPRGTLLKEPLLLISPFAQTDELETVPLPSQNQLRTTLPSQPEIPGFTAADDPEFEKRSTFPMMVLKGISAQQGKPEPEMKSEVSGAAGAAGLVGIGNILGSVLKYGSAFLIQYGFGPGGFGLYTLCLSLVNLVSAIFNLGLDDAMVRYVAIYRGKQQIKSLRVLLLFCTTLAGLAGICGALLLLYFTPSLVTYWITLKQHQIANRDTLNRAISLLQVMAPIIPLMTMQVMWFAGLRGFKAFKWRVLTTNFLQPLLQIILLCLVLIFFRSEEHTSELQS